MFITSKEKYQFEEGECNNFKELLIARENNSKITKKMPFNPYLNIYWRMMQGSLEHLEHTGCTNLHCFWDTLKQKAKKFGIIFSLKSFKFHVPRPLKPV